MQGELLMWALLLPGMLLGSYATSRVKANVSKYSRVPLQQGMTGAQVARYILDARGLPDVGVERAQGVLGDHYDPRSRVLRLSNKVFDVPSVAAAGIAAHEAGHAIQDAEDYAPLEARTRIVPLVQAGSTIAPFVFFGGMFIGSSGLMWIGAILFGLSTLFSLITLPVEFDASRRALKLLREKGIIRDPNELQGAEKVLDAAAWTYVAAAISAVGTLVFYLILSRGRAR
jgi:Zn-dependent membrane protease YugP